MASIKREFFIPDTKGNGHEWIDSFGDTFCQLCGTYVWELKSGRPCTALIPMRSSLLDWLGKNGA